MKSRLSFLLGVCACSLLLASSASAATITFDPPAQTGNVHTIGNATFVAVDSTTGYTIPADVFLGSDENVFNGDATKALLITFLNPVYSLSSFVGVEVTGPLGTTVTDAFRVRLYTSLFNMIIGNELFEDTYDATVVQEYAEGSFAYAGGPVKHALLTFDSSNTPFAQYALDNLTYEEAAPVPEPATLALFGLGAAGVRALRRRKSA